MMKEKYKHLPVEFKEGKYGGIMARCKVSSLPWYKFITKWKLSKWEYVYVFLSCPLHADYYDEAHWYLWTDKENARNNMHTFGELLEYIREYNYSQEKEFWNVKNDRNDIAKHNSR